MNGNLATQAQALAESLSTARFGTTAFAEMCLFDAYDILTEKQAKAFRRGPLREGREVRIAKQKKEK